jgi:hypothetical protein
VTAFKGTGEGSTVPSEVFFFVETAVDCTSSLMRSYQSTSLTSTNLRKCHVSAYSLYTPRLSITTSNDMKWTFPVCQPARLASRAAPKPVVIVAVLASAAAAAAVQVVLVVMVVLLLAVTKVPFIMAQKHICPFPTNFRRVGTYLLNYTSVTSNATATFMMNAVKVKQPCVGLGRA